jgi:hypothetical protein
MDAMRCAPFISHALSGWFARARFLSASSPDLLTHGIY